MLFDIGNHIFEHTSFHFHNVLHGINIRHLKVQSDIFVEVTGGIVALSSIDIANFKHTSEDTSGVLLVELRRLCQICLLTKIVELKDIGAALCAGRYDFRGMDMVKPC